MTDETWNIEGEAGKKTVVLKLNGDTIRKEYDSNSNVGDVVREIAREHNLPSVNVKDESGFAVTSAQQNETLGEVGNLEMIPKDSGA